MSTRILRYFRLLALLVLVSPWATAFGAGTFSTLSFAPEDPADARDGTATASDSTAGQCRFTAYDPPCMPLPPCPPSQGPSTALQGSTSSSLGGPSLSGSSSTSPNPSLFEGEQIGATGVGMVAVNDSPGGYIDNAIIGNVLRYRTDLAFDDENPDMAEFIYAKCGCFRHFGVDPNARGPGENLEQKINYQELSGYMELSYNDRFSAFVEMPVRFIQFQTNFTDNAGGIGDLNAGFKFAVIHDAERFVTAQLRVYVPTGDSYEGFGTGHISLEPAVLYWRRLSERLCVQGELRDWIPMGGSDFQGNVFRYGVGAGYDLITPCCSENCWGGRQMRLTAVGEIVGWEVLGGQYSTGSVPEIDASGTSILNLKIGPRLTWCQNSLYVGWGHCITEQAWYRDIARFEFVHSF